MPVTHPGKGGKKKGGGGWRGALKRLPGDFTRNVEDIVTGLPSGALATFDALDKALPKSPIPGVDEGQKTWGDRDPIKKLAIASALAMKEDLRHPLRNPANTLLTALAVPSLGAGGAARGTAAISTASRVGRGAKIAEGLKAARRKPYKEREVHGIRDPQQVLGDRYKIKLGKVDGRQLFDVIEKKPPRSGPKRYLEDTTFNPVLRGLRKVTIDPFHKRSIKKASAQEANPTFKKGAKIIVQGSKEYENITRGAMKSGGIRSKLLEANVAGVKRSKTGAIQVIDKSQLKPVRGGSYARFQERRIKDKRKRYSDQGVGREPVQREMGLAENILHAPMDLLRLNMYASGRYAVQNNVSTALMNALAGVSPRHVGQVRGIKKTDPATYERMKGAMGQTATGSYAAAGSTGTGRLGQLTRKMGEFMSHPEMVQRTAALARVAEDMGIDPPTLARLLEHPNNNRTQVLLQRANERVGDLSRYGGSSKFGKMEQAFVGSGLPIFYPMTKAFTRYTARMPLMYPAKSAFLAQMGTMGNQVQEQAFGGEVQPYYGYYAPAGKGKTLNMQNILPWSPGGDILRETANTFPGQSEDLPYLNLLNNLGPLPELLGAAATGREVSSGFDVKGLEESGSAIGAAKDNLRHLLPFNEFYLPTESKAHGNLSIQDKLALRALGPGLYPRKTDYRKLVKKKKGNKISRRGSYGGNSG